MKQFKNLDEALHYHYNCPLCRDVMNASFSKLLVNNGKTTITFQLGGDSVEVDYFGDDIKWFPERSTTYRPRIEMFKVMVICGDCSKYSYVLQVHADSTDNKVTGIFLNSEHISIEREDELHEIKNIYAMNKTEYDKFTRVDEHTEVVSMAGWLGRRNGTVSLPLIPLDIDNPDKTLDRIKGLIIFS